MRSGIYYRHDGKWNSAISRGNVLMMRIDLLMDSSGVTQPDKTEFYRRLAEFVLVFTLSGAAIVAI